MLSTQPRYQLEPKHRHLYINGVSWWNVWTTQIYKMWGKKHQNEKSAEPIRAAFWISFFFLYPSDSLWCYATPFLSVFFLIEYNFSLLIYLLFSGEEDVEQRSGHHSLLASIGFLSNDSILVPQPISHGDQVVDNCLLHVHCWKRRFSHVTGCTRADTF